MMSAREALSIGSKKLNKKGIIGSLFESKLLIKDILQISDEDLISSSEIIYTFQNKHLSKINRDPVFKNYLIRTDKNYKVKVLNAGKNFSFENKKFSDKDCNEEKNNFIKILTDNLNLNSSNFKDIYRKNIDEKRSFDHPDPDNHSVVTNVSFIFDSGNKVMVGCVEREDKTSDLRVILRTKEYSFFINNKAYK